MLNEPQHKKNTGEENHSSPKINGDLQSLVIKYKFNGSSEKNLDKAFDVLFEEVMKNKAANSALTTIGN
jgi:hypothetical protein